jgi:uncharacterized RDD family membrane protein YckC
VIPEDLWRQKSDQELEVAVRQLDDYTEDAQQVILAEIHRRGMVEAASKASVALQYPPQQPAPKYAEFWLRFVAAWIDAIILRIVQSLLVGAYAALSLSKSGFLGLGIAILTSWLYYAFSESSSEQATLGKQALGIFVTDLDGNRISFGKATGRYFGKWLSTITFLLGYVMAAFTEKHQALHDLLAGTLVIRKSNR